MYTITIRIPCRMFVAKYIQARYAQQVWDINKADRIGKVLYSLLDRMPARTDRADLELGGDLEIRICRDYCEAKGIYLSNAAILEFNDFIYQELIEEIARYMFGVKNRLGLKKYDQLFVKQKGVQGTKVRVIRDPDLFQYLEKREIIYDILKLYDISENDLAFETIKKALQRLKLPLLKAS